jgi:predicted DCC family thiol-disulfide oxidoreductase YuxK
MSAQNESSHPPLLLYDGDCGFCTVAAHWLLRRTHPSAAVVAWQTVPIQQWSLTPEQCESAVQFVTVDHQVLSGAPAVVALLRSGKGLWPVVGKVMTWPLVAQIAAVVYVQVARHRGSLPGATAACRQPSAQG